MEFSRQEYWSGLPFPSPGDGSSRPRDRTWVSWTAGRFFTVWAVREAPLHFTWEIKCVLPAGLFSSLLLCNRPSPNLRPKQHIYFAHKSALWADLHGEDPSLIHLVQAGVPQRLEGRIHLKTYSLPGLDWRWLMLGPSLELLTRTPTNGLCFLPAWSLGSQGGLAKRESEVETSSPFINRTRNHTGRLYWSEQSWRREDVHLQSSGFLGWWSSE